MRATVYAMPDGPGTALELAPRLESWNAKDHPDQVALRAWVGHVRERLDPRLAGIDGPAAVRLDIGLPDAVDPLWQRDLDNYLYPIARELSGQVVSFWATKTRASRSYIRVEPARRSGQPDWQRFDVPRALGSESAWKQAVRAAVRSAVELPEGPAAVQIALASGPDRSWPGLWKRTIDGLDPILGRSSAWKDWDPQDGRIVPLGIHRRINEAFRHDAQATVWATTAADHWPELAWLAAMTTPERAAFFAEHRLRRPGNQPAPSSGTATRPTANGGASSQRRRSPRQLAPGLTSLLTEQQFNDAIAAGTPIVITDSAGPPKLHTQPRECNGITEEHFIAKVITGAGVNGRYFRADDLRSAEARWPRLAPCKNCERLGQRPAAATTQIPHRNAE